MTIFIYATTLTGFTSSIPMRGLLLETIKLRTNDLFLLYFSKKDINVSYLNNFFTELSKHINVKLIFVDFNKRWINLKALLGFKKYLPINIEADLYVSPGTIDHFGALKKPLINILADLSQIRTPHSTSVPWHGKYIMKNQLKYTVKYSSHIICISNFTRHDLISLYPDIKDKTTTIYNGIENEWFDDKYEVFEIDNITNYKYGYFIWYGYISKRKNIVSLLKAYKELLDLYDKEKIPKIILVGSVAPNQNIVNELIKTELSELVKLIPHQDLYKLKYLLKHSKGLLFPSFYEGFGLPVIEAYSQGKNVLYSDVSSLPEIANGLGINCDPYNIESIKQALLKMSELKDSEDDIFKRKQWASSFTYEKAAQEFSKIIDEVMALNI